MHGGAKDRSKQLAFLMKKSGMISLRELFRKMDITDQHAAQIMKEMKEEAEMQQASAPQGKTPRISRGARNGNPMAA
jgi:CTP-dependent riboflavin kinase